MSIETKITPDWFDMNLTELMDKSLKLGVIPLFQFVDKGTVLTEIDEGKGKEARSIAEQTPIDVLNKEVKFYESFILKIQKKEGFTFTKPDAEQKLADLEKQLKKQVRTFKKAIKLLNKIDNP
jgi:hypothetical protein